MSPGHEFIKQSGAQSDSTNAKKDIDKKDAGAHQQINFAAVDTDAYYKYSNNYQYASPDTGILPPAQDLLMDPHALRAADFAIMGDMGKALQNKDFKHIAQIVGGFKSNPEHLQDIVKSFHLELENKHLDKRYEVGLKNNVLYVLDKSEASATSHGHYRYFSTDGKIIADKF